MRAGHCATPQDRAEPFGREAAAQACIWLREAFDEVGRTRHYSGQGFGYERADNRRRC